MRRNIRFIKALITMKLSRMTAFRISFFGAFFADATLFLVQLATFIAVYSHVDGVGDWSKGEMIIFVGTFSLINALNMVIYFFGVVNIPDKIKRGDLDQYLTKPVNPLLRLTFENINPGSLPLVALSVLIVVYGAAEAGIRVTFGMGLGYAGMVLLMTLLWYDMEVILRTIPFFSVAANGIMELEGPLLELNFKVPGTLFKGGQKVLFYFILPYGIMSTIPSQFMAGTVTPLGLAVSALTVVIFTAFALWFWRFGLKHYKSGGG